MKQKVVHILGVPLLTLTLILSGCAPAEESTNAQDRLEIYAAASLKSAFEQILEDFRKDNPDIDVAPPVYDGSSTLAEQINEGAPADVFASADEKNMTKIVDANLAQGQPQLFAMNAITLAVPKGNPGAVTSLKDLENPGLNVVLCAPQVPCGSSAEALLRSEGLTIEAASLEQNVSAVATKIASGEADAGLVYTTDVRASGGKLREIPTPVTASLVNRYPIVALKGATPEAAQKFIDYVVSDKGQAVLERFGFGTPR